MAATHTRRVSTKRPRSPSPATSSGRKARLPSPDTVVSHAAPSTTPSHFPKLTDAESPSKAKKLKLQATYTKASPFPEYAHPTPAEAQEVFDLLAQAHRTESGAPVRKPPTTSSNAAKTCGSVPNVIESLIGTILSQNTSAQNSTRAKKGLDDAFGRNNFAAIVDAPNSAVVDAIRSGGLANKKATTIQNMLKSIKAKHGDYSLQHLGAIEDETKMADDDIMQELISYDGVGPKTASCVLLFCLGRNSFAVDTHVFRISKVLGWVPAKATRITAQGHLDLRIPNDLKYGLHVLMIQHGRVCKGCKKSGSHESCILKTYLKNRKGEKQTDIDVKLENVKEE